MAVCPWSSQSLRPVICVLKGVAFRPLQSLVPLSKNCDLQVAIVAAAGDLNDFEFSAPIGVLESAGLTALIEALPANERYGYNFEGNAQALDHLMASARLVEDLADVDAVQFWEGRKYHALFHMLGQDTPFWDPASFTFYRKGNDGVWSKSD